MDASIPQNCLLLTERISEGGSCSEWIDGNFDSSDKKFCSNPYRTNCQDSLISWIVVKDRFESFEKVVIILTEIIRGV